MALTPKQQRFVDEYLVDLNATAAYGRARYKATGNAAGVNASRLLRNAKVQEAIAAARQRQSAKTEIDAARIIKEHATIAFSDLGDIMDFSGEQPRLKPANQIPEAARRAVSSIKVRRYTEGTGEDAREVEVTEFRFWSKESSLAKLAEYFPMPAPPREPIKVDVTSGGKPLEPITPDETFAKFGHVFERMFAGGAQENPGAPPVLPSHNGNGKPLDSLSGNGKPH